MKKILKNILPPILAEIYRKIQSPKYGWFGDFDSWSDAEKASTGYESNEILNQIRESAFKVKNKEAVYERDGVVFEEVEYSWPLLAGLMYATTQSKNKLHVLDFGGSLGSTYFQNKKFLDKLDDVSWSIIEQKHFVDIGKADFEDGRLSFYYDIENCMEAKNPNILVMSSVLQYIEKPYELLTDLLNYDFKFIMFDRTPFSTERRDIIKVQNVPESIYKASYPCWFFNEKKLVSKVKDSNYELIEKFEANDGKKQECEFNGMIFQRK